MDPIAAAKEISNEAAQLVDTLENEKGGTTSTGSIPTYSSSTTSCEVDPETGVVTLVTKLYPGETPIPPAPEETVEEPVQETPPGQVPAQ